MSKKFTPRILPLRKLPPKRHGAEIIQNILMAIVLMVLAFDGGMYVKDLIMLHQLEKAMIRTNDRVTELMADAVQCEAKKDTTAPQAEGDDGVPLTPLIDAETRGALPSQTTVIGHSEALPESDGLPAAPPHHHRAAKAEPTADELNSRWYHMYPHGTDRLVPLP